VWQRHVGSGVFDALPNRGLINLFTPDAKVVGGQDDDATASAASSSPSKAHEAGSDDADALAHVPVQYQGLDRYEARKAVLAELEAAGLLVETAPHKLHVPRGDRSGVAIEPYLTDQWFVKMDTLGARGLELVEGTNGQP